MSTPFAINGLGRIGRALVRIAWERSDLELVAANELVPPAQVARLLARDTLHGPFGHEVAGWEGTLEIEGHRVALFAAGDPAEIPWARTGARVVVEATGAFTHRAAAARHLGGSVDRVVVAANGPDLDLTLCLGVNEDRYDPARHRVLSNASCTTNCLAPVARVLDRAFGLERALLNTVHCYNSNQRLLDSGHADPRRARAATLNMIPTTTGAIAALSAVMPELAGRIAGLAVRVPTPDVSLIDLVVQLAANPTDDEVRAAFRSAAAGPLAGILGVVEEELVSSDFLGDPRSAIVDLPLLQSVDRELHRVVAWYDNEWGYASRLADLVALVGSGLDPAAALS